MNPVAIAQLIASLLPSLIQLYNNIASQYSGQVPPIETILAQADANWNAIATAAQAEIKPGPGPGSGSAPSSGPAPASTS